MPPPEIHKSQRGEGVAGEDSSKYYTQNVYILFYIEMLCGMEAVAQPRYRAAKMIFMPF